MISWQFTVVYVCVGNTIRKRQIKGGWGTIRSEELLVVLNVRKFGFFAVSPNDLRFLAHP